MSAKLTTTNSGAKLILLDRDFSASTSFRIFFKGGILRENSLNNGIGSLFVRTFIKSSPFLNNVEFLGGFACMNQGVDYTEVAVDIPHYHQSKVISDLEAFLLKPTLKEDIFELEKKLLLEELALSLDSPNYVSFTNYMKNSYNDFAYGLPANGEITTVQEITLDALKSYMKPLLTASNITATVVGKVEKGTGEKIASILNAMDKGELFECIDNNSYLSKNTYLEEPYDRIKQAKLYVGYNAPSVLGKHYPTLKLANSILGSGMSSRYFSKLRKEKGYAYSVGSMYPSRLFESRFTAYIGLDYCNVASAIDEISRINNGFLDNITPEEIEDNKNKIIGNALIDNQTNSKIAWNACFFENVGLGYKHMDNYLETIRNIQLNDLKEIIHTFSKERTVYVLKPES